MKKYGRLAINSGLLSVFGYVVGVGISALLDNKNANSIVTYGADFGDGLNGLNLIWQAPIAGFLGAGAACFVKKFFCKQKYSELKQDLEATNSYGATGEGQLGSDRNNDRDTNTNTTTMKTSAGLYVLLSVNNESASEGDDEESVCSEGSEGNGSLGRKNEDALDRKEQKTNERIGLTFMQVEIDPKTGKPLEESKHDCDLESGENISGNLFTLWTESDYEEFIIYGEKTAELNTRVIISEAKFSERSEPIGPLRQETYPQQQGKQCLIQ